MSEVGYSWAKKKGKEIEGLEGEMEIELLCLHPTLTACQSVPITKYRLSDVVDSGNYKS